MITQSLLDFVTPLVIFGTLLMKNAARLSHVGDGAIILVPDGQQLSRYTNIPTGNTITALKQAITGINTTVTGTNAQIAAATTALQAQDLVNVTAVKAAGQALLAATPETVAGLLQTYIAAIQTSAPYDAITLLLAMANSLPIAQINETFTRASTASYVTTLGGVASVAANILRFDAGPPFSTTPAPFTPNRVALALVEGAGTNLCKNSATIAGTGWSNTSLTINTQNAAVSPDGLTKATLIAGNVTGYTQINTGVTMVVGAVYTFSVYAKANIYSVLRMTASGELIATFDLLNRVITSTLPSKMQALGNGWFRVSATFTKTNTSDGFFIGMF
jgi:hypothetical protein